MSVLVVDDDPDQVSALTEILRDEQLDARAATSGAEAISRIDARWPDALVLDVDLPDMDASDVIRSVRAIRPGVEVVLLTGFPPDWPPVARAIAANASYLAKPVVIPRLLEVLAGATGALREST